MAGLRRTDTLTYPILIGLCGLLALTSLIAERVEWTSRLRTAKRRELTRSVVDRLLGKEELPW